MTADEFRRLVVLTLATVVVLAGVTGGYGTAALLRDEAATGATFSAAGNFETASGPSPGAGNVPNSGAGNAPGGAAGNSPDEGVGTASASNAANAPSGPPASDENESSTSGGPAGPPERQHRSPARHTLFEATRSGGANRLGRPGS